MAFRFDPKPPLWMRGGHLETIGSALLSRPRDLTAQQGGLPLQASWRRHRIELEDGDFFDMDVMGDPDSHTHVTLFHGLEGSSHSHYATAFAVAAMARGWSIAVPHFRGCSGENNRLARAYHSGDVHDVQSMLRASQVHAQASRHLAIGVSLGGNALTLWACLQEESARQHIRAMAALGAPIDLASAGRAIQRGANQWIYTPMFLRTMRRKAREKAQLHPGTFDLHSVLRARTIEAFDDAFTAPLHGFQGVADYYERASAKPHLGKVAIPCLLVNAKNDPFVPWRAMTEGAQASEFVAFANPSHGGHVGYSHRQQWWDGRGSLRPMADAVLDWLNQRGS